MQTKSPKFSIDALNVLANMLICEWYSIFFYSLFFLFTHIIKGKKKTLYPPNINFMPVASLFFFFFCFCPRGSGFLVLYYINCCKDRLIKTGIILFCSSTNASFTNAKDSIMWGLLGTTMQIVDLMWPAIGGRYPNNIPNTRLVTYP